MARAHAPRQSECAAWRASVYDDDVTSAEIPFKKVPDNVLFEAGEGLLNFIVPMYVLSERPDRTDRPLLFIGSGTLVDVDGSLNILTAGHVWNEAKDAPKLGLGLTMRHPSAFWITDDNLMTVQVLWHGETSGPHSEWGPDLALVRLHRPEDIERIKAHKSAVNLSQHRTEFLAAQLAGNRACAITGMVGEWTHTDVDHATRMISGTPRLQAFFGPSIPGRHERDGYDYVDVAVNLRLPDVPQSFGGVSGGGLWEIGLSKTPSGAISWDGKRRFRGVAFWQQSPTPDGLSMIRCHGPHSVFTSAWQSWELPTP
jgi:hypothetical protein